jgi:hypothetical protein
MRLVRSGISRACLFQAATACSFLLLILASMRDFDGELGALHDLRILTLQRGRLGEAAVMKRPEAREELLLAGAGFRH